MTVYISTIFKAKCYFITTHGNIEVLVRPLWIIEENIYDTDKSRINIQ